MATTPLDSALTASLSDSDKAYHLLALLLSLCRPTRPSELAARCTAFPATAHLVQRLCSVANSPISFSDDLHVTPSLLALTALAESFSCSSAAAAGGASSAYSGKRKRFVLDCGLVPSVKRRLIVDFENVNEDNGARKSVLCIPLKVHFCMTDYLRSRIHMLPSYVSVGLDKPMSSSLFTEDSAGPSSCGVKNIDDVEDHMETDITPEMNVRKIVLACADNVESTVPPVSQDLVLYEEAKMHEIDSLAKSCLEKSKQSITSPGVDEKLPGIDSRKLEDDDYEDTLTLRKRLIRILETRAKFPVTDFSAAEKQFLQPSEKVSNDSVLHERAKMHLKTKDSRTLPALDENYSCKVINTTILEDVRTIENDEEGLFVDPGNLNGETENLSQPDAAVYDKQPGIGSSRLKEEDVEATTPLHKEHMGSYNTMPALDESVNGICKGRNATILKDKIIMGDAEEGSLLNPSNPKEETENPYQPYTGFSDKPPRTHFRNLNEDFQVTALDNKGFMTRNDTRTTSPASKFYVPRKQLLKSSATMKVISKDKVLTRQQSLHDYNLEQDQTVVTPNVRLHLKMNQKTNSMVHKSKQNCGDMFINERKRRYKSIASKDQTEKKELPNFDSYVVEEEEGSGGYGTVYRARSKNDRTRVAIKCPHDNAHKSHVNNELGMLERFGGKNFVIKYEGCIKNGNSSCFVLQHVEHDRPEVLKKEIDVCGLRWYGYCLFRALASLHKQGVVHRDVKPGNFLFSRKANKGYLIDFNLSMDLHQKYGNISKSREGFGVNSSDEKLMTAKNLPPITLRKLPSGKSLLTANGEISKGFKSTIVMKDLKKMAFSQMKANNDSGSRSIIKSQGADGSIITSVKDVTSTRTLSAERMREPLPSQGRKELINLVQEAREGQNASSISALMRKRVPAPPVNVDGKLFHVTPMPMHSTTNGIGGPFLIRSRGLGKHKEGPCAGTKGFRAPEVLLRSPHQGPKIDIWSAGVTLLYLLIGRTPFLGEPELNIKDIAKLRGSEDLWEVAKLHDRESSFPVELYNTDCLPSIKLKDWCRRNTKRPDFLEEIPRPLFDLVDKCLMVNPRVRLSAEEALKHEFFAPCHEQLRKHRLLRQVL
ncbi:uncharacterized protein LOC126795506 [Argentina anserina]|uniref:uncharacterized protein LOC126795506 n=1 Tax=Argentina anserina TaxID=57926 RepID=UPI00217648B1|nr:uncharacterized protein LOC126795506 [Potentilla anserina]